MKESAAPNTIDGVRIESAAKNGVYLQYVASPAKAISADGLAFVDMTTGIISTAFPAI